LRERIGVKEFQLMGASSETPSPVVAKPRHLLPQSREKEVKNHPPGRYD